MGVSLGMLISALIKNVEMAPRVAPAFVILFLMFSGFFLNDESVPVYMVWLKHISFIKYTFQGLCVNEFRGATFEEGCAAEPDGGNGTAAANYCATGDDVLEQLSFDSVELWFVVMVRASLCPKKTPPVAWFDRAGVCADELGDWIQFPYPGVSDLVRARGQVPAFTALQERVTCVEISATAQLGVDASC